MRRLSHLIKSAMSYLIFCAECGVHHAYPPCLPPGE